MNALENIPMPEDENLIGAVWKRDVFVVPLASTTRNRINALVKASGVMIG